MESAPQLPLLPWAPELVLHFQLLLMSESSVSLAPGPQLQSVGAADCAVLGVPLDTEGGKSENTKSRMKLL